MLLAILGHPKFGLHQQVKVPILEVIWKFSYRGTWQDSNIRPSSIVLCTEEQVKATPSTHWISSCWDMELCIGVA